ncbi:FkbM family methyltransferase [Flavobacteriaceae bacterium XHP0103]|uniref:FkbM family methyltransferase n=1 Tax=Marixanthotalea marina TaxID=2844359 RepID=UPI002989B57B|nr:FkbM family methyltransferase [Marixanthotalea marina]MBU3822754.1 FkbM family methyltransferase [Marixanthotalea marina]
MKNKLKRFIKKSIKRLGYSLVKDNHSKSGKININNTYGKNNLLANFYSQLLKQNYEPSVIYDIGANKGTWTKECLKYFPNATYYLFEPQINLKDDIDSLLSDKKNVQLFSVGVGNTNGELDFTIHKRNDSCSFRFSEAEAIQRGFKQIKVPIFKLDDFAIENNLMNPSILKIDAEGLDIEVLQGANNLVKKTEIIMIEVGVMNKNINNSVLKVMNYLDQIGFRFFDITDLNRPFKNNVLWLCEFVFIKKDGVLDIDYLKVL